ncbi:transketolase [Mucilaginibacter sp. Mucisp86]|uniref:transketolase n=1 Tax=Mucilaginibacter sp. Mucisp86 TaxID=3243060 RepID=UPI0039B45F8E
MKVNSQLIQTLAIDTVRVLAADAVQQANSGHPGTAMALAPVAHVLWTSFMNYDPFNPQWANRDRFILSNGHACILQYAMLYLTGYDLTLDDLKAFRQLNSKTPGHPEYGLTPGIEVTTGPLGQGFANSVGFAIGQKHLAARYNKPGFELFNYRIFCICGDGDMMEGVTSEAASLAGQLELGNMICIYDDNHITIEGDTDLAFTEDVGKRFEAYNWHVQTVADGNDLPAIAEAIRTAIGETSRPSLIRLRTQIGYGSPNKVNTAAAHGSPLGTGELKLVKQFFGFDTEQSFVVPQEVLKYYRDAGTKGMGQEKQWNDLFKSYKEDFPGLAAEYELFSSGGLPKGWEACLPVFEPDEKGMATRAASGQVLNAIAERLPALVGGAADLSPSTDTILKNYYSFNAEHREGRNFHFGIREHAMGSALNGMALTRGLIPYGATFLIFSEYMRPPIRLAAIMEIRPVYVFTHDSIGLGEDGTTHQPVEQLISLRSIPNLVVIRPADANETAQAWRVALRRNDGPVALILTRQNIPVIDQAKYGHADGLEKGAYILSEAQAFPDIILMASGSEVALILEAQVRLEREGIAARVISMPSWELFGKQDSAYREQVLPKAVRKRLAVEMGSPLGWREYVTDEGDVLAMSTYGQSAPAADLYREYGFTVENVIRRAKALLEVI